MAKAEVYITLTGQPRGEFLILLTLLGSHGLHLLFVFACFYFGHFLVKLRLPCIKGFCSDRRASRLRFLRLQGV